MALTARSNEPKRFRMCYSFAFLVFLCSPAGYSQSPAPQPSSPDQYTIGVQTELVVLPVRVMDMHGDFVSGVERG